MNPEMNPEMTPDEQRTDDCIEMVLTGLREAKPSPGMEQRISSAILRQAGAVQAKQRWTWLRMPLIAGTAAVVAAALLVSAHFYRQTAVARTADQIALRVPAESRTAAKATGGQPLNPNRMEKAEGFSLRNQRPLHEGLQLQPASSGAEAPFQGQLVGGLKAAALPGNATSTAATGRRPSTPEASRSTLLATTEQGFPAPPLPLTEQERLLIRLVHRDDPVQLAQLAPAAREAELQRDREQMREFFKPPPMLAANFKLEPYPVTGGSE